MHFKTAAAVLAANAVSRLPHPALCWRLAPATCLLAAWAVWRREKKGKKPDAAARLSRPSLVAFASIAFTEWGDPGQLATARMAIRFSRSVARWGAAPSRPC